jgi:hypothetical protein
MSKDFRNDITTKGQLKELVFEAAEKNHIWVNAFTLIRPTETTYADIGRAVVQMMQDRENLLPSYTGGDDSDPVHDLSRLTPTLYMSINAS